MVSQEQQLSLDDELEIPPDATISPTSISISLEGALPSSSNDGVASTATIWLSPESCLRPNGGRGWMVGRQAATADIRIQHASISRKHAVLYVVNETLYLKDLGGKHGTCVNQSRIQGTVELKSGDSVQFGNVAQVFRVQIIRSNNNTASTCTSNGTKDEVAAVVAEVSHEEGTTQSSSSTSLVVQDISRIEQAGEGLSGRAKRQAEIAAMMDSLEQAPTYQTHTSITQQSGTVADASNSAENVTAREVVEEENSVLLRLAQQNNLPLLQRLSLASELRRGSITCLAIDPAGSRFVVGSTDTHLRWFDFGGMLRNRMESFLDTIPEDGQLLQDVVFSHTGDRILVATSSAQPLVLDREGQEILKFCRGDMYVTDPAKTVGHTAQITSVDWHPLERNLTLTGSLDGSARLWNLNGKKQFEMLVCDKVFAAKSAKGHRTGVTCVAFHPGGREFAVGTSCGSIQIWNRSRASVTRPERAVFDAHGVGKPINSLTFTGDGSKLASRSSDDDTVRVWNSLKLGRTSAPLLICKNLETIHEKANACFSPDGRLICAGRSESRGHGEARRGSGSFHVFRVPSSGAADSTLSTEAFFSLPLDGSPVLVRWHAKLNQIFVACADGRILIFFDSECSSKGAVTVASKAGRTIDVLSDLLRSKAESSVITGEILTPFSTPKTEVESQKRKRQDHENPVKSREPERPATGKHKTGVQTGGNVTFQQFVADQRVSKAKAIAGKDPREALFQYAEGKSIVGSAYEGNVHKLADKTAEEEEEEMKSKRT